MSWCFVMGANQLHPPHKADVGVTPPQVCHGFAVQAAVTGDELLQPGQVGKQVFYGGGIGKRGAGNVQLDCVRGKGDVAQAFRPGKFDFWVMAGEKPRLLGGNLCLPQVHLLHMGQPMQRPFHCLPAAFSRNGGSFRAAVADTAQLHRIFHIASRF